MERRVVCSEDAPAAIGPYSQAVVAGNLVFLSGQIALDPVTGQMVGEDVAAQTRQVLRNLKAVLEEAGSGLARLVQTTIYLADLGDFAVVNGIYAEAFSGEYPARATVEVSRLPRDARVEIAGVALLND